MPDTMAARIETLQRMTTAQLREEWRRVMGDEPRTYNKAWMWKRLAWAIQAKEYGGLSALAQKRLEELLPFAEMWMPIGRKAFQGNGATPPAKATRDGGLPSPGTVLTRRYKGRTLAVSVLADGFEYEGRRYDSLTAIATAVTGSHWNGWHFFGLKGSRKAG